MHPIGVQRLGSQSVLGAERPAVRFVRWHGAQLGHWLVAAAGRNFVPSQRARDVPQFLQVGPRCNPSSCCGFGRQLVQRETHFLALVLRAMGSWSREVSSTYEVNRTRFRSSELSQVVFDPKA